MTTDKIKAVLVVIRGIRNEMLKLRSYFSKLIRVLYLLIFPATVLTSCGERTDAKMNANIQEGMLRKTASLVIALAKGDGQPPQTLKPITLLNNITPSDAPRYLNYYEPTTKKEHPWLYYPTSLGDSEKILLMAAVPHKMFGENRRLVAWGNGETEWILDTGGRKRTRGQNRGQDEIVN